jgi:hypothetical protein
MSALAVIAKWSVSTSTRSSVRAKGLVDYAFFNAPVMTAQRGLAINLQAAVLTVGIS